MRQVDRHFYRLGTVIELSGQTFKVTTRIYITYCHLESCTICSLSYFDAMSRKIAKEMFEGAIKEVAVVTYEQSISYYGVIEKYDIRVLLLYYKDEFEHFLWCQRKCVRIRMIKRYSDSDEM